MLDSGADINARGSRDKFPVDQAIFGGNLAAAGKLLDLGASSGDGCFRGGVGLPSERISGQNSP